VLSQPIYQLTSSLHLVMQQRVGTRLRHWKSDWVTCVQQPNIDRVIAVDKSSQALIMSHFIIRTNIHVSDNGPTTISTRHKEDI
jgi:hypothetical protein